MKKELKKVGLWALALLLVFVLTNGCQVTPIATITASVDLNAQGSQSSQITVNFTDAEVVTLNNQTLIVFSNDDGDTMQLTFSGTSVSPNTFEMDQNNYLSGSFTIFNGSSQQTIQVVSKNAGFVNLYNLASSGGSSSGSGDFHVNFDNSTSGTGSTSTTYSGSGFGSFNF
ncbi:MAG: hypothetical protein R3A11_01385 [Bdellovibrionota bacterium]